MATIVDMPRLSDTMTEGTLAGWKKQIGDKVAAGDALAEIETDKAVMVFESFDAGVLLATILKPGDTVPLGTPMAILGKAGEDVSALVADAEQRVAAALAGPASPEPRAPEPAPRATEPEPRATEPRAPEPEPRAPAPSAAPSPEPRAPEPSGPLPTFTDADGRRTPASPLARRIAAQRGIDLAAVAGTGPRGRIVASDLEGLDAPRKLSARLARSARPTEDEVVRVTQMRKTIAKRLVASMQEAPHYYLTVTLDASRLVALRAELNEILAPESLKLSYNDLVMRGAVVALGLHPSVNAAWEGATLRRFAGVHLGFAVALPEGLITPVIRDADRKDLVALARQTRELAAKARDQKLESHEYSGNSFCVSNLGMFGIEHFTAVINPPAACILAVGALVERPVVRAGQVVAGHTMTLTMSADHRAVDGATGAAFLQDLVKILEAPTRLVL